MTAIYDVKTYDPQNSAGQLINRLRAVMIEVLDKELARFDLTAAQYVVVSMLAEGKADSASRICKEISYDPGAMTRMIDRLEQKGFLRRVHNPANRRMTQLVLTDEGRQIHPELRACTVAVLNRLLRGFSKTEVRQFENFMQRMVANA